MESREPPREVVYTNTHWEHLDASARLVKLIVEHDPMSLQSNYSQFLNVWKNQQLNNTQLEGFQMQMFFPF